MANKFVLLRTPKNEQSPLQDICPCFQNANDNTRVTTLKQCRVNKATMDRGWGKEYDYVIAKIYKKGE